MIQFPAVEERPLFLSQLNRMNSKINSHKATMNPETGSLYGVVSKNYKLTKHEDFLEAILAAIEECPEYGKPNLNVKFFDKGSKMRANLVFPDVEVEINRGDKVNFQIEALNSYDSGWSRQIFDGAFRQICTNGLTIGNKELAYRQKHSSSFNKQDVKELLIVSLEKFSEQQKIWESWVDRVTTPKEYENVISQLGLSQKDEEAIGKEIEVSSNLVISDIQAKSLSYWLFFNILCQYLTHRISSHLKRVQIENVMRRVF